MPLAQRHRTQLHDKLAPIVGEDTIEALLAEFPATDLDKPASQAFVRAEAADVRTEVANVRTELHALEARIGERLRQQTVWMSSMLLAGMGAAAAIAPFVG